MFLDVEPISRDPGGDDANSVGRRQQNHPRQSLSKQNHPQQRQLQHGYRGEYPRGPPPPPPPFGYVDLQIGNHMRTVHPSPIKSDQVITVPCLFGSDLNLTSFWELREELEPLLRDKYREKFGRGGGGDDAGWTLGSVRGSKMMVAPQLQGRPDARLGGGKRSWNEDGGGGAAREACDDDDNDEGDPGSHPLRAPALVVSSHSSRDVNDGRGSGGGGAAAGPALTAAFLRVCRYYSIDPGTAIMNAGIRFGRPSVKLHPAHSAKNRTNNCFVIASFGSPRRVVLHRGQNNASFRMPLSNNAVVAILGDVSRDGWLYGIENADFDDVCADGTDTGGSNGNMPSGNRAETITLFVSGHCTRLLARQGRDDRHRPPPPPPPTVISPAPMPPPGRHTACGGLPEGGSNSGLDMAVAEDVPPQPRRGGFGGGDGGAVGESPTGAEWDYAGEVDDPQHHRTPVPASLSSGALMRRSRSRSSSPPGPVRKQPRV